MAKQSKVHAFSGLRFEVVSAQERDQVLAMRLGVYAVEWPNTPVELVVDSLDECSYHLAAYVESDHSIVAAARIVPSEHRPFDLERYVPLSTILPANRNAAELGRLCIRRDCRRMPQLSLGLLKLSLGVASRAGITDFVLTSLPSLRNFYRKAYFSFVGVAFEHPTWGPVDVMRMDIESLLQDLHGSRQSTPQLLLEPDYTHFVFGE